MVVGVAADIVTLYDFEFEVKVSEIPAPDTVRAVPSALTFVIVTVAVILESAVTTTYNPLVEDPPGPLIAAVELTSPN